MALKTQGFTLSALPRAPQVPGNIGKIDVKEIYDGVRRGLESFELARTAAPRMALADAEIAAKTEQAPLATRGLLAQTEAAEQQLPIRTSLLAAEASPEMQEAKRQALLNRGTKAPSGDIQLASALANAKIRLAEDPNDAAAAQLISVLEPMALKKSAASMADPRAAIDAGVQKTADTNQTRRDITGQQIASQQTIAAQNADVRREGFTNAQDVARIGAQGRVDAARATNLNKAYQTAAEQNQQIQTALGSLALLEDKADQYLASSLGSGPVVGSAPALFLRGAFGDTTGQELKAAIGQEMTNAVRTVQGLGAMSNIEFGAVMEQLPKPTDQGTAIIAKLEYLKAIRPWLSARSNLYMSELERGVSPVEAYQKVRTAFPVPPVPGAAALSSSPTPVTVQGTAGGAAATPTPAAPPSAGGFRIIEVR